jgi:hypothetical protein
MAQYTKGRRRVTSGQGWSTAQETASTLAALAQRAGPHASPLVRSVDRGGAIRAILSYLAEPGVPCDSQRATQATSRNEEEE